MPEAGDGSTWRKSSLSGGDGCVEVRQRKDGGVDLRDSKDRDGPKLTFSEREWRAFTAGVRAGEFQQRTSTGPVDP